MRAFTFVRRTMTTLVRSRGTICRTLGVTRVPLSPKCTVIFEENAKNLRKSARKACKRYNPNDPNVFWIIRISCLLDTLSSGTFFF